MMRRALILALIFLGIHYLYLKFANSDEFLLENIEVKSDTEFVKRDILDKLEGIKGKKLGEIDLDKLSEILKSDVRVSSVEINSKPPHSIFVDIHEKKPYVCIVYKNKVYAADDTGEVFAYWQETSSEDLIVLNINEEKEIKDLITVIEKIENFEMKNKISSIFKSSENEVRIVLNDGTVFKTSKKIGDEKYKVAGKLYKYLKSKDMKIDYIDIRFRDYIVK